LAVHLGAALAEPAGAADSEPAAEAEPAESGDLAGSDPPPQAETMAPITIMAARIATSAKFFMIVFLPRGCQKRPALKHQLGLIRQLRAF
jgi:hypothetical protein